MKKIVYISIILLILSCKAQIITLEDFEDYPTELPDGAYLKDVNNILGKYVGTWKGTYNNQNYEFVVVKTTFENTTLKYKHDKLLIRYKITNNSGTVLANTLNLPNGDKYIIRGSYLAKSGSYVLSYLGLNGKCGQNGTVFISVYDVNNVKMKLFLEPYGEIYSECTTGYAGQILPTDWIDLTKQ
ncbi:DUF6705 family protein [uncultured Gelidibacter sp.]|uniref:DUF6705 family protein n=1 Tax=uncultured Gelidibacter sp. TaxID=259318 RepID=UPI0026143DE6|nr:DUF6705 family protein [uncultured Gelidibacter sp.]